MNDLTPYTRPPLTEIANLSPIQTWAIDILVQGLRNRTSATTNVLTTAYGGLATMADRVP